MAPRF